MFGPTPKPGSLPYRTLSGVAQDPVPLMSTEPDLSVSSECGGVGFASKCMRHPWEGTIHQHTAIWADHRRRTARPVRDCTAIASLVAPCHSGEIQVKTARDCNHHQTSTHSMLCHLQKLLKPCPRRSSSVWALMLGPMMTARKLEKQQRSRYRSDGSGRHPKGAA